MQVVHGRLHSPSRINWKPFDALATLGDLALGEAGLPERSLVLPAAEHMLPQLPDNDSSDPVFLDSIVLSGI